MKKITSVFIISLLTLSICICSGCNRSPVDEGTNNTSSSNVPPVTSVGENGSRSDKEVGFQLEMPSEGETIAILETSMGIIKIRLFPNEAPLAVENFITLINNGYYNNLTFHRVVDNFMIQTGDPTGTGSGGESCWGENFADEFNSNLINLRGSVAMANSGVNTNGSQFFINQNPGYISKDDAVANEKSYNDNYDSYKNYCKETYDYYVQQYGNTFKDNYPTFESYFTRLYYCAPITSKVPDKVWELYEQNGGNLSLDGSFRSSGGHTVFGQVFEGLDVVDAIAAVEVQDSQSNKPVTDITIIKAYTQEYSANTENDNSESVSAS